jgi:hypothetical protein
MGVKGVLTACLAPMVADAHAGPVPKCACGRCEHARTPMRCMRQVASSSGDTQEHTVHGFGENSLLNPLITRGALLLVSEGYASCVA